MSIYVFLADGFEEMEAVVPSDILKRAGADVLFVSVSGRDVALGAHGMRITTDVKQNDVNIDSCEAIILPGGSKGTSVLAQSEFVLSCIEESVQKGKYVCAICAAPSILGSMGLLAGRKATCYPSFAKYIDSSIYTGADVEKDDIFITGKAAGASYDFGLRIVESLYGEQIAEGIRKEIFY